MIKPIRLLLPIFTVFVILFYACKKAETGTMTDLRDGQIYKTVKIGNQWWMAENLNYNQSSYGNDWCYANDSSNSIIYGRLYNWYAAMQGASSVSNNYGKVQGVCPHGWHIPSDAEWKQLEMYLGMSRTYSDNDGNRSTEKKGKLKETSTTHWRYPNTGATNSSGFTALPGGRYTDGSFNDLGYYTLFWTSTEYYYDTTVAWYRGLSWNNYFINRYAYSKKHGYSVRCVKN